MERSPTSSLYDGDTGELRIAEGLVDAGDAVAGGVRLVREGRRRHGDDLLLRRTGRRSRTNALIERKGATRGAADDRRLPRHPAHPARHRPRHFDLHWVKPWPLRAARADAWVSRERVLRRRRGAASRLDEARRARRGACACATPATVSAIAVSYLFSFVISAHERAHARADRGGQARRAGVALARGAAALARVRADLDDGARRVSEAGDARLHADSSRTTLRRAGIGQLLEPALERRRDDAGQGEASSRSRSSARAPSGGIMASARLGRLLGLGDLIACDMGGTSFEACLLPAPSRRSQPGGARVRRPDRADMVDARAIGAGAARRPGSTPPASSWSGRRAPAPTPGPPATAAAARRPTVTDANVVLGRLAPEFLLAGDCARRRRGRARARRRSPAQLGLSRSASRRGSSVGELEHGAGAPPRLDRPRLRPARRRSVARRRPTAARCDLARAPADAARSSFRVYPGAFSAFGALLGRHPLRLHADATGCGCAIWTSRPPPTSSPRSRRAQRSDFRHEGFDEAPRLVRSIDMRYVGQNWELDVPMPRRRADRRRLRRLRAALFEAEHERFYGYSIPGEELELADVQRRCRRDAAYDRAAAARDGPAARAARAPRAVDASRRTRVRSRPPSTTATRSGAGTEIDGPGAWSVRSTRRRSLPPGSDGRVDEYGNLRDHRSEGALMSLTTSTDRADRHGSLPARDHPQPPDHDLQARWGSR